MSELGFLGLAALGAVVWLVVTTFHRARRGGITPVAQLRRRLSRSRRRTSPDRSIVARGAWKHSLAAAYVQGPGRVVIRVHELVLLVAALLAIAGSEVAVAFGPLLLGEILAAALVPLLLIGAPARPGTPSERGVQRLNLALRALALVPLLRVMGIAIAHPDVRTAVSILVIGVLGCWLAVRAAPALEMPRSALIAYPWQPTPLLVGYVLSLVAYLAGAPVLAAEGTPGGEIALAVAALALAAAAEELIFRGVLQTSLQRVAGRPGVLLGACLFACTYLGFRSLGLALVMLLAGLLFSDTVLRTGAVGAAVVGHVFIAVGACVVWPYLLGREHPGWVDDSVLAAVLAACVVLALLRLLRGRGAGLSVRRGAAAGPVASARLSRGST